MTACPICDLIYQTVAPGPDRTNVDCQRCGKFALTGSADAEWPNLSRQKSARGIVSHYLRRRQRGENRPLVNSNELKRALNEALPTPQEQADNFIRWLGENSIPGEPIQVSNEDHGGIAGAAHRLGFAFIVRGLMNGGLIDPFRVTDSGEGPAVLTFKGWERYQLLKRGDVASTTAFMAMPFGQPLIQRLLDTCFKPAVAQTGYNLEKLNDRPKAGLIDDRLRVAIQSCRFLIADVTHQNRGAYWESGYAEGLGKSVIYTCEASAFKEQEGREGVHFDTNHHLHVLWTEDKLDEAAEELKATIRATIPEAKRKDD